ncbi:MAG: glucose-1-phosphate adenylyltransferase [bacterium]
MHNVITLILGGGRGTRLYPLTRIRSKPAVPLGGKFRLVDIPISNALHAGLDRIFVLTQFNSASLHRHVTTTYRFGYFQEGFVDILAASQTLGEQQTDWYEGTADAVRKTLSHLEGYNVERVLILSGDQLYRMDFAEVIREHVERGATVTVSGVVKGPDEVSGLGIMRMDRKGRIEGFVEKPGSSEEVEGFEIPTGLLPEGAGSGGPCYAASMGIYLWELKALKEALAAHPEAADFGHEIIPAAVDSYDVYAHLFDGYWEDIGTVGSFFEANLALTREKPPFQFFHKGRSIYTRPRYLPPARVHGGKTQDTVLADGADLRHCTVIHSVVGIRAVIRRGAEVRDTVIMGGDLYPDTKAGEQDIPPIGIGEGARIRRAIIDKNARIGRDVVIEGKEGIEDRDEDHFSVRDGIVVIPKNTVIPDGTRIKA